MNIGFDAKRIFFNRSGLGNYSRDLITILSSFYKSNSYLLYRESKRSSIDFSYPSNTVEIKPLSKLYRRIGAAWRSWGVVKDLDRDNLDIYHGLSGELPFGIEKASCKSVVTVHDCIFMRYPELYDRLYKRTFEFKSRESLKVADSIVAISEQTKRDIVKYFNIDASRIDVIYQGCNESFREKATEQLRERVKIKYSLPDEFILYVGTVEPRKNLLSIFEAVNKFGIDTPIVAVGRATPYLDKIKRYIADENMSNQTLFLHDVENEELPTIYQEASLFIYPSMFEGFGIPILEALCSGTPVITTSSGVFPEVGGDAAEYVEYGNVDEMGSKISMLLSDRGYSKAAVERGYVQADKFTQDKIANRWIEHYQKVLNS